MTVLDRLRAMLMRWDNPWPNAVPLPPHVQAVKLDEKLLLHMAQAHKPSAHTGYVKPMKDNR